MFFDPQGSKYENFVWAMQFLLLVLNNDWRTNVVPITYVFIWPNILILNIINKII